MLGYLLNPLELNAKEFNWNSFRISTKKKRLLLLLRLNKNIKVQLRKKMFSNNKN